MMPSGESIWRFGNVEYDEARGKLQVGRQSLNLDRNSRAILLLLLHAEGAEVSKERLLEAGWPDRIVHENSLAKAIGRLRRLLGEDGEALETVYGHGYRLNSEVSKGPLAEAASPEPRPQPFLGSSRRRNHVLLPAALALVGVGGLGGAVMLDRRDPDPATQFRTAAPITADAPDTVGRLLWVDDNPQNNIYEERFFEDRRIAVHAVKSSGDALRLLSMYDYDVVLSDMGRGEDRLAGLRLVEQMRARKDQTPFIIYTIRPDGAAAQEAQRQHAAEAGAQGVVVTPQEVRAVILRLFGNPQKRPDERG